METDEFQRMLRQQGEELYRDMPWRQDTRPYYVLVSELMLQQTQVDRVIPKFEAFIAAFPDEHALAQTSLADVLRLWQGLGYNRRAKFLHDAAKRVVELGEFPQDTAGLMTLPGVGKNTAGAIMAYAYNQPADFIETNVRAVYIHHFFADMDLVDDKEIQKLLESTIDRDHPREFYWALMDYGSWLKKQGVKPSRSSHYKKQSALKGSVREVRGQIVAALSIEDLNEHNLCEQLSGDERFQPALDGLIRDGLVMRTNDSLHLTK
jgi:A/G-specific adenine glycosylase